MNAPADDPFDTAAELEAEARMMESRADTGREDSVEATFKWKAQNVEQYDKANREMKSALEEARTARDESLQARTSARNTMDDMAAAEDKIEQLEKDGNLDEANEMREDLHTYRGQIEAMNTRAVAATKAAQDADARVATHAQEADGLYNAMQQRYGQLETDEQRFDNMEDSAVVMHTAAAQMAEAERLDAAADDLEARGVAGAGRVRAAAVQSRADAAKSVQDAEVLDPTKSYGTDSNAGIDDTQIEIIPTPVGDDGEIEMDPVDLSGNDIDAQIERELDHLQPLEPAPEPILTPEQVEPVAFAPSEPQWDDTAEVAFDDAGDDAMFDG